METEYLGNAYTTQSSNDGCVAVACPIDAGCAINACGTAACGANACPADICVTAGCVANVSIILLDEPTSALDKDSIDDLKKYLTSIKKNRIIIISTHDKNIVDLADVTINLDKGHIFEAEVL